ncbi:hypothetical protein JCM10049v2_006407 [Rhodotorula toruloides]
MPRSMNQYTQLFAPSQAPSKGSFDEAAADLSAFLDFSSLTNDASVAVPAHEQPSSAFSNAFSGLRPVDDSLLDSPLDLELSPASSFATSPFDFGNPASSGSEFTSPLLDGSFDSPLVESYPIASVANDMPSLFAPAPSAAFAGAGGIDLAALASSIGLSLPPLPSFAPAPAPMMEDIKPVIPSSSSSPVQLARTESTLFDVPSAESTPAQTAAQRRKTAAQIKKEAAASLEEKPFKRDKFTGIRNTKKPPVAYDAPTLPKNYLTESATSKKRAGSAKVAASVSKRARSEASVTPAPAPAPELPQAQPEPINEDNLDDDQLAAIELKRRSNTLAARRSRARKAAYIQELKDEIDRLKQLNEALQGELGAARAAKCACQG